jgi:hypothetical protein
MTLLIPSDQGEKVKFPSRHDLDIFIYYILAQRGLQIWRFARAIKFFVKIAYCHRNHVTL